MQTIRESIEITEEGKRRRVESERELVRLEGELKQALLQSGSVQTRLLESDQEAPAPTNLLDE